MSLTCRFSRIFALLACAICIPAMAAAADSVTVKIKLDRLSMIIVPVSINDSGPYDFLLDTGCSNTLIDQELATQLELPQVGEGKIIGVLGSSSISLVRANSVSVDGVTVRDLRISATTSGMTVSKVRGVLGQDFLQRFDVLIDYHHLFVQFAPALGSLSQSLAGEHLLLHVDETNAGHGAPNRLIVTGQVPELGNGEMSLLLDSGANYFTLLQDKLGPLAVRQDSVHIGKFGFWTNSSVATRTVHKLSLGKKSVSDLTLVTLEHPINTYIDGLIPTSLFSSIFISSRGGFVILNPSFSKTTRDGLR
jgi:predicted aspartyl protease